VEGEEEDRAKHYKIQNTCPPYHAAGTFPHQLPPRCKYRSQLLSCCNHTHLFEVLEESIGAAEGFFTQRIHTAKERGGQGIQEKVDAERRMKRAHD
jgi:hypothetical protein